MMPNPIDLTGQKFGRLTAISVVRGYNKRRWLCRCDCGQERVVAPCNLKSGNSRSCGCLMAELSSANHTTHGATKGRSPSKEYEAWKGLRRRCLSPSRSDFERYGARGITVCERWLHGNGERSGFELFLQDMGPSPAGHSVDRIDNDKGYDPSNCKWSTPIEQLYNRRNTITLTIDGIEMKIPEAAKKYGIPADVIRKRLWKGHSAIDAVSRPLGRWPAATSTDFHTAVTEESS